MVTGESYYSSVGNDNILNYYVTTTNDDCTCEGGITYSSEDYRVGSCTGAGEGSWCTTCGDVSYWAGGREEPVAGVRDTDGRGVGTGRRGWCRRLFWYGNLQ